MMMSIPDKLKEAIVGSNWELVTEVYKDLTGQDIDVENDDEEEKVELVTIEPQKEKPEMVSGTVRLDMNQFQFETCGQDAKILKANEKKKSKIKARPKKKRASYTYVCHQCNKEEKTTIRREDRSLYLCQQCICNKGR